MRSESNRFGRNICENLEPRCMLAAAWQPLTLDFAGPSTNELATAPNPFLDYRLDVAFTHNDGTTFNVPGFYDGDGKGGSSGNIWRVRFTPDRAGSWSYDVNFRTGSQVAISLDPNAGTPTAFDGRTGSLNITAPDRSAPGFLGRGLLEYTGDHYLHTLDGQPWVKGGVNSPENFLSYTGFDGTPEAEHGYSTHTADWNAGDPDWGNGKGKAIIGSLNYLSELGINSLYALPMNIGGDGSDVWPFAGPIDTSGDPSNDNLHYDISKLAQWETVFSHAMTKGIQLHLVLMEAEGENKMELDNATLGVERKLFYREFAARFGHHNAVQWNISEEYNYKLKMSPDAIKEFAGYLQAADPYDHPITVHNYSGVSAFDPFLGDSRFSATSFQTSGNHGGRGATTELYRTKSEEAGRPIPINLDEANGTSTTNQVGQRKDLLWPTMISGGGVEFYVGGEDLSLDDFHRHASLWTWTGYAVDFFEQNLPFDQMDPNDGLLTGESSSLGGGQVFAKAGAVYAVYLPNASTTGSLNLTHASGTFEQRWFNPRTGQFEGTARTFNGGTTVALGAAPNTASEDWVVLLKSTNGTPPVETRPAAPDAVVASSQGSGRVSLTWRDNSNNEDGFLIERGDAGDPNSFESVGFTSANVRAYADDTITPGLSYVYRVRAFNEVGNSAYGTSDTVATPLPDIRTVPTAPTALTATANGAGRIDLTWADNSADEANFRIERSTSANGTYTTLATVGANTTTYANTGLPASTTYFYRVRAINSVGDSAASAVASATTAATTPPPATTFGVTRLVLVDATTGRDLMVLTDGMTLDLTKLSSRKLNVRAEVSGSVHSVRFGLDKDSDYRTENEAIYSLAGDTDGQYKSWTPSDGNHTLTATAYTKDRAGGTASTPLVIRFTVID